MASERLSKAFLKGQVFSLLSEGKSVRETSRKVNVPERTIRTWRSDGFRLERRHGSGRPRMTSPQTDQSIIRTVSDDPSLSLSEIAAVTGVSLSRKSIHRRLKEERFVSRKRASRLELTPHHKEARMTWAMNRCHWRSPQWKRIVWSDEASFHLKERDGRLRIWVRSGEEVPDRFFFPRIQGGGGRLLVWGAIWLGGRSDLHIQEETMNSRRYVDVLERHVCPLSFELGDPTTEWIFMDDNASSHRSALTKEFKRQAGIRTLQWPARSPDLNPIENVWSLLKRNVRRKIQPGDTLERLRSLLETEWHNLDQSCFDRIINSMPSRVSAVLKLNGGVTKY